MNSLRLKFLGILWSYGLVVGSLLGLLLVYLLPQYYTDWYPGLLIFFLLFETGIVLWVESYSKKATARQLSNAYMLTKVVKIFTALILVGIYAAVVGTGMKSFVLIFMLLYILFLVVETHLFTRIEKNLKKEKEKIE